MPVVKIRPSMEECIIGQEAAIQLLVVVIGILQIRITLLSVVAPITPHRENALLLAVVE